MPPRRRFADLTRRPRREWRLLWLMCLLLVTVWMLAPIAARPRTWDWLFREPPAAAPDARPSAVPIRITDSEAIQDQTFGLRPEERNSFLNLLAAAEEAPVGTGRRDITYRDLLSRPSLCRGEAIELWGTIRRMQRCTEELVDDPAGPLWMVWLFTDESGTRPYCLVLREIPEDLSPGVRVEIPAGATGYFFKLTRYVSPGGTADAALLAAGGLKRSP